MTSRRRGRRRPSFRDADEDTWSGSDSENLREPATSSCTFGGFSWFGRSQSEVETDLRRKIGTLKRENRQLRDLAKNKGASIGDIRRATDIFEPLTPVRLSLHPVQYFQSSGTSSGHNLRRKYRRVID